MISTRKSVISTRRVLFLHAESNLNTQCEFDSHECDYNTHECDFNTHKRAFCTQNAISTRRVWFWHICVWIWRSRLRLRHAQVWLLHAECKFCTQCDFDRHKCDYNTHECDFNTHKIDFYTQSSNLADLFFLGTFEAEAGTKKLRTQKKVDTVANRCLTLQSS
jgi:hypothetical protein